jgi:hypothetical protein
MAYALRPPATIGQPQFPSAGGVLGSQPRAGGVLGRMGGGRVRQSYMESGDEFPLLNRLFQNKNALLGLGAGLLSGDWGTGFQGAMQGRQIDQEGRDRTEATRLQQERDQAVREALIAAGMDPAQVEQVMAISPDAAGTAAVQSIIPQGGETEFEGGVLIDKRTGRIIADTRQPEAAPTSDDIREFEYARTNNGYTGTLQEWIAQNRQPLVTIPPPPPNETAYDRDVGVADAATRTAIFDAEDNAIQLMTTLDLMDTLMLDPNFYTGFGANQLQSLRRLGAALGITDPAATASGEAFQAAANDAVLKMLGGTLGAQVSNTDRQFIRETMPNLTYSEAGNRMLIEIGRRLAQRKLEIAAMLREYTSDPAHPRLDDNFRRQVAEYAEANPLFSVPEAAPAAVPGGAPAGGAVPPPPAGVPPDQWPALWGAMTPAERAAFQ